MWIAVSVSACLRLQHCDRRTPSLLLSRRVCLRNVCVVGGAAWTGISSNVAG